MHIGIGAIIGNKTKEQFFIQQKDEHYPITKWKGAFSFWGGAIEKEDTSQLMALKRELEEELRVPFVFEEDDLVFIKTFEITTNKEPFVFHLYEILLEEEAFSQLQNAMVLEGKGQLVPFENLQKLTWVWGLEEVVDYYCIKG